MKFQPITCVWEITMGCNMRCGHCGSSCTEALPDELNTDEALDVCDQIADLGIRWVTLSGGEPITRKDLPLLVQRLSRNGVAVNIITNGWLLTEYMVQELKKSGVSTIAISMDGTQEIYDKIRKQGAYQHAMDAFRLIKEAGIRAGAVTTISNQNLNILNDLKEELIKAGVESWQVQIGLPMGNMKEKPDWVIAPEQIEELIDFCYQTALEGRIKIYPADCIGYYTQKEQEIKRISYQSGQVSSWDGCNAGIRGFGILHNGDILGCTSIRSKEFVEGSVRGRSLRDIWADDNSFLWRRNLRKNQLTGECENCQYGSKCLGGCPNTRLTMNGDIYSDNQYCAYHLNMKRVKARYENNDNAEELEKIADMLIQTRNYQEAGIVLKRLLELKPNHMQALKSLGFCNYKCENYEACKKNNEKVLQQNPNDYEALRGLAVATFYSGDREQGIEMMMKAAQLAGGSNMDIMDDLEKMNERQITYLKEVSNETYFIRDI